MIEQKKKCKVEIEGSDDFFYCKEDQHILTGMASMGKKGIPSGCHGGGCGVCKIRVIQGNIRTKTMSTEHVSEAEKKQGYALACRTFPRSDIRLKVIGKISKNILKPVRKKYGLV